MATCELAGASDCQLGNQTGYPRQEKPVRRLQSGRLINATETRISQIVSALSVALDITQGHPQGHCMRTGLIGMRLAGVLDLPKDDCSALFYSLLLKDLGCSSNAAKIAYLFGADDHRVKQSLRMIDWTKPAQAMSHCWSNCTPQGSTIEKVMKMAAIVHSGPEGGRKISETRCERGADIARMLQLPEATVDAIRHLDEHWNGRGTPNGLMGYATSACNEIGVWGTVRVFDDTRTIDGFGWTTWRPINQISTYWHHKWHCGGPDTWLSIGIPEQTRLSGGGSLGDWLVSATTVYPFGDRVAAYTNVMYMHQSASAGDAGAQEDAWNLTIGIAFYPGHNARSPNVSGQRWMPLLPVANNGSFLVDASNWY
jgi:hypothetical protein